MSGTAHAPPALVLIAAMSRNRVIGRGGKLPWRLRTDMARFKARTMGRPLIVGRRTYDDIGRPLPGRTMVVLSSRPVEIRDGVAWASTLTEALDIGRADAAARGCGEVMVAGGAEIYAQTVSFADRIVLTVVDAEVEGDAFFPEFDLDLWREVSRGRAPEGPDDDHSMTFLNFEAIRPRR